MGTDVERIVETLKFVHELWASIPEIGVAVWLLARQVYGASAVPLIICLGQLSGKLGFLHASLIPMPSLRSSPSADIHMQHPCRQCRWSPRYGPAQRQWVECVQKRIAVTASMLLDMKAVQMLGLTPVLHEIVSRLRKVELQTSERFRSLLVCQIVIRRSTASTHRSRKIVRVANSMAS